MDSEEGLQALDPLLFNALVTRPARTGDPVLAANETARTIHQSIFPSVVLARKFGRRQVDDLAYSWRKACF